MASAEKEKKKMGLLSCFLAPKEKIPSPEPSINPPKPCRSINLCSKGYGHYDEEAFKDAIYRNCVEQDWWIESEAYAKLLSDMGTVDFSGLQRGANVSDLIARLPKDMPANPGVRFPRHRGTLGGDDYAPLLFVRVGPELLRDFLRLLELSGGFGKPGNYFEVLRNAVTAAVPSYDRDSFESTFGLVWDFSVVVKTKSVMIEN